MNFYDVLGVKKDASQDQIKKAYRKLAHSIDSIVQKMIPTVHK